MPDWQPAKPKPMIAKTTMVPRRAEHGITYENLAIT